MEKTEQNIVRDAVHPERISHSFTRRSSLRTYSEPGVNAEIQQLQSAHSTLMKLSQENAFLMASKKALDKEFSELGYETHQQQQSPPCPEAPIRCKSFPAAGGIEELIRSTSHSFRQRSVPFPEELMGEISDSE